MFGKLSIAGVLVALTLGPAGPAAADYVSGLNPQGDNFLSLRSGPGTGFDRLLKLAPDTELTVLESSGKWRRVQLNDGTVGWAYGKYIAPGLPPGTAGPKLDGDSGPAGLTGATLRAATLRANPGAGAARLGGLRAGAGVIVLGQSGDWLRVLGADGLPGYVAARDVAIGAAPVPAVTTGATPVVGNTGGGKGAAHEPAPAVGGWTRYVNDRFGTRIDYPADYFTPGPPPENNDGQQFFSRDGRAEFMVFGQYNFLGQELDNLREEDKQTGGYDSITYERTRNNWYVLSGYRGDRIYYRRVELERDGETMHVFEMNFPASDKPLLEQALTRMSRSFGYD